VRLIRGECRPQVLGWITPRFQRCAPCQRNGGAGAADERRARYAAVLGIVGALDIPLIHFAVEWWRGQHPQAIIITEEGPKLAGPLLPPLMVSLLAFTLLYLFVMLVRVRLEQTRDQIAAMQMEAM